MPPPRVAADGDDAGAAVGAQRRTVAVVVPTRNATRTIVVCLASLRAQTYPCAVVVADNFSDDGTRDLARPLADHLMVQGPERSAQRNAGAAALPADVIGFVDADMRLEPMVVAEAVAAIDAGAAAVIVPERTVGVGYWAAVRAFERSFYLDQAGVEAARFFRRDIFDMVGGFDEALDAGEDWDLTLRVRPLGPVARTIAFIDHDEGRVSYWGACRKKGRYAAGMVRFGRKHGWSGLRHAADRPFIRRPQRLLGPHPLLGAGVIALKAGEGAAVAAALVGSQTRPWRSLARRVARRSGQLVYTHEADSDGAGPVPPRYRAASSWAGSLSGRSVADIGCWTGGLLSYLAEACGPSELLGIDLPGPWLDWATDHYPSVRFEAVESLLSPIPAPDSHFHTVFFLETLEHLPRGTECQVLRNLGKLLVPGGELILSTPAAGIAALADPAWWLTGHCHYTYRRLATLCNEAGLAVREIAWSGNFWSMLDINLLYVSKHVLRRAYRRSRLMQAHTATTHFSRRRLGADTIWVRMSRRSDGTQG